MAGLNALFPRVLYSMTDNNLALNKQYEMSAPDYPHTRDDGDQIQLTDGKLVSDDFWKSKSAVGWFGYEPIDVTIDLKAPCAIAGVSFRAASKKGFMWPESILVLVSDNKKAWYFLGDLVVRKDHKKAPPQKVQVQKYERTNFKTYGRYVKLIVVPDFCRYTFADEITVTGGDPQWVNTANRGKKITNVQNFRLTYTMTHLIKGQLFEDWEHLVADIEHLQDKDKRTFYTAQAAMLKKEINNLPLTEIEGFQAILPMNTLEKTIFRFNAEVWRAQKKPLIRIWQNHRWDPLSPSEEPEDTAGDKTGDGIDPSLKVEMMNNEHRADVLNITNAAATPKLVSIRIAGSLDRDTLDRDTIHDTIDIFQVLTTGTRRAGAVSSAFMPLEKTNGVYNISIPSGMTRQLWFAFHPKELPAGRHNGKVVIAAEGTTKQEIPLTLAISPIKFPDQTRLLVGGWSYTNIPDRQRRFIAVTPHNRKQIIGILQEHHVNAPWATMHALPVGKYDITGKMIQEPDTVNFDAWVRLWPDADKYCVYLRPFRSFGEIQPGKPQFQKKIEAWTGFWMQHLQYLGLEPNQLVLLLKDEPSGTEDYELVNKWANAFNKAAPGFVIWENPHPQKQFAGEEMLETADVLCIHRRYWLFWRQSGHWFQNIFLKQQRRGCDLWFYSPDSHARDLDPYTYYLGQAWHCFQIDAKGSCFWGFSDMQETPVWNEYLSEKTGPFTPLFISNKSVFASKQMAAVREGSQDFEYLVMLKSSVARLKKQGFDNKKVDETSALLNTACTRVLQNMDHPDHYRWKSTRDRSIADDMRMDILHSLESLESIVHETHFQKQQ